MDEIAIWPSEMDRNAKLVVTYRRRAQELRTEAQGMAHPENAKALHAIADSYDALAKRIVERGQLDPMPP